MVTSASQNLPPVLEMVQAVYGGSAAYLPPPGRPGLAQRARHLAAGVRFGLDEPQAMLLLHSVTHRLRDVPRLDVLLPRVLDGALWLTRADFGNIQLFDPVTGSLRIVTQSGFGSEFVNYFGVVDDEHSACGRAAKECAQTVIADVTTDPGFAPHRDIAAASGFRAVQSTPLADYAGRLIGVVSTHFRSPRRPPDPDLRAMELYGDFAGEAVARRLGVPADDGGDPIGRAVISALLEPGDGQEPNVTALSVPGGGGGCSVHQSASLEEKMPGLAGDIVARLFSVGLSLDSARSIIGDGSAGDRVAAATDEVDRLIRDIRTFVFSLAADRGKRPPASGRDR
jgi:hypothetical protein